MDTPCVKICTYDRVHRLCAGCGRTLEEIALWADFTDEKRRALMAELPARLERLRPAN
jgi:uncharacterized protein